MNGTCPDNARLLLFSEGGLSDAEAAQVAEHVAGCEVCETALSELRVLTSALRGARGSRSTRAPGARAGEEQSERCPGAERIAGYADGSLNAGDASEVESHIVSCESCRAEVADLWALSGASDRDVPDTVVAAVLARLEAESRTAVLRWAGRSIVLLRDFASSLAGDLMNGQAPAREPALAAARSDSSEVRLHWRGSGGADIEGVVRAEGAGVSLTGRVTVDAAPVVSASVALSSDETTRGPESLDADGRFGPWPLSGGVNTLRLTGLTRDAGHAMEFFVRVDANGDAAP